MKGYLDTHQICKNASWYEYGMDYNNESKAHAAKVGQYLVNLLDLTG